VLAKGKGKQQAVQYHRKENMHENRLRVNNFKVKMVLTHDNAILTLTHLIYSRNYDQRAEITEY
jgi:hypothetical protein